MIGKEKSVVWLHGEVKTPPFSTTARREAGALLGLVQHGHSLEMPCSRPMPSIGTRCHELRIHDDNQIWRVVYCIEPDAIVILEVFAKKTRATPKKIIDVCKKRFRQYQEDVKS